MSLELVTIREIVQVFIAYLFCAFLVPYFIFRRHFARTASFSEKFLICFLTGNFFMINIVYLLFLLHIGNHTTLFLFTLIPVLAAWYKGNRPPVGRFLHLLYQSVQRYLSGETKLRTVFFLLLVPLKRSVRKTAHSIKKHLCAHWLEWCMLVLCLGFTLWLSSYQTVHTYGYGTSDLVVHNKWINGLEDGEIFSSGIYPYGLHNIIYFLHAIFGFDIYVLLRVFGPVFSVFIYLMLYILLRRVCSSKYTPLAGLYLYSIPSVFNTWATIRYQWTLPQEFAMLFLYPCSYFLLQFFNRKYEERKKEKELKKQGKLYGWLTIYHLRPSTISLILFAMSFSLTFTTHFYITIIAFFLCLAIALSFLPLTLHPGYWKGILTAGILSMVIAIAPMGIAYAQGTQLEPSLNWGLEQIHGNQDTSGTQQESANSGSDTDTGAAASATASSIYSSGQSQSAGRKDSTPKASLAEKLQSQAATLKAFSLSLLNRFYMMQGTVINSLQDTRAVVAVSFLLLAVSIVLILCRRKIYYRNLAALALYTWFMIFLHCAPAFGLPTLMDNSRTRIFLAYSIPLVIACAIDCLNTFLAPGLHRFRRLREVPALFLIGLLIIGTLTRNGLRQPSGTYALQSKGEMICNYNIMNNFPEKKWTIISTTDDLHIIGDKGWHTEITDFLGAMNNYSEESLVQIPTPYVFFYIEKNTLDYSNFYNFSDSIATVGKVSTAAARRTCRYTGSQTYFPSNRHILESKFYYWAKAFQKLYPNELRVYYEDEDFICYYITQNEYHLYNFAIDYGYNE